MCVQEMVENQFPELTKEVLSSEEANEGLKTPLNYDIFNEWVNNFPTEPCVREFK